MKKIYLLILTLIFGISSFSFAADNEKVSRAALFSFQKGFKNAQQVSWEQTSSCFKATFYIDGQALYAYYDKGTSELIAVTRFILSNQLPLNLQQELRGKMNNGWIVDLFEVAAEGETFYYATVENGSEKRVFKSSGFSDWSTISKKEK
jgi:hypothetical protein